MSDFGADSFHSLGTLECSPRTNMRKNEQSCCFQLSSSTPETVIMTESEMDHYQDSFSSIFSRESMDFPARLPFRKLSPKRDASGAEYMRGGSGGNLSLPSIHGESDRPMGAVVSLPPLRKRTDFGMMGHSSFSSFFSPDRPIRRPERTTSPTPTFSGLIEPSRRRIHSEG